MENRVHAMLHATEILRVVAIVHAMGTVATAIVRAMAIRHVPVIPQVMDIIVPAMQPATDIVVYATTPATGMSPVVVIIRVIFIVHVLLTHHGNWRF